MSSPKQFHRERTEHTDSIQSNVRDDKIDPSDCTMEMAVFIQFVYSYMYI